MKRIPSLKLITALALLTFALVQNAIAASTIVTDAVGTQELWTFEEVLGAQKLTSKINQADNKGITQTWDANGNKLTRTDAEGRTTTYTYNATNQRTSMTEASGTPEARSTTYEYVSADIDLITKTTYPSVFAGNAKEVINSYDANLNITSVTINGFNALGGPLARATTFAHDQYGKVTQINGARSDVNDITTLQYYDCNTGAECGQLKKITNALGHISTFDAYDAAARLLQSTDANGIVTTYTYHPRGWLLSRTQTPSIGAARVTGYDYDNVGQLSKTTYADGSEQNYVYDAAHDLRAISDNLGDTIEYTYDAKGNRTHELVKDPDGTLVRRTIRNYDIRNFIASINTGGSITQLINDAVGNLSTQTDPNANPTTDHSFDALDRLTTTIDALTNNTNYQYNVADQLSQVQAPNGAVTQYEYDDLGNQSKEISPDRGTLIYAHDSAGNVTSISDARGITQTYQYDALNRISNISYPNASENISYSYDSANCGASIGRLCKITDESGQTDYQYDAWGNLTQQTKVELGFSYVTLYQYDVQNRVTQIVYPDGRIVDYQRDAIGRITGVSSTIEGATTTLISNRTYRADGLSTGHTQGNGLQQSRTYDLQGRVSTITLGTLANWNYSFDANGNVTQIDKAQDAYVYGYDVLDRLTQETTPPASQSFSYDANSNRLSDGSQNYDYVANSNQLALTGPDAVLLDAVGNTLSQGTKSYAYNDQGRLTTANDLIEVTTGRGKNRTTTIEEVEVAQYRYNAQGQRTQKITPDATTVYHYDLQGQMIAESDEQGGIHTAYFWLDGAPIAQNKTITTTVTTGKGKKNRVTTTTTEDYLTYLHTDHLATPRIGTNDAGNIVWQWQSDAFGQISPDEDPDGDGSATTINLRLPGQYYDQETGLYYNWNRYYDAEVGRYVTSDPIGLDGGLNTYGYVLANPLLYYDALGLKTCGSGWNEIFVPDNPHGFEFSGCCQDHDDCYPKCNKPKEECDSDFYTCMLDSCSKINRSAYGRIAVCKRAAKKYYSAVKRFGGGAYDDSQKDCPDCEK